MVASVDGATAIDGVSGGLGGPADKTVFRAIRAVADVIVVAAGTARAEGYGPPRTAPADQEARRARGQQAFPRLALVSRSLDLDPTSPMFAEAPEPPLVFTVAGAAPDRHRAVEAVAEVVVLPGDGVDPVELLADLHQRGCRVVLAEGGPSLNAQLVAAGVVDEVDLSLSPMLVGGTSSRVAIGGVERPADLALAHLWEADGLLFARYVRA
ncbi:MAG: dihydrofolate reductase family protein [Actinobacteria bacterium]|nr:dihydrofolate reductase family protein [Actinomycetota bacterium]